MFPFDCCCPCIDCFPFYIIGTSLFYSLRCSLRFLNLFDYLMMTNWVWVVGSLWETVQTGALAYLVAEVYCRFVQETSAISIVVPVVLVTLGNFLRRIGGVEPR